MNRSQLLYKISNLQYSIRIKEIEYKEALNRNDYFQVNVFNTALSCLKQDLEKSLKDFETEESVPVYEEPIPVKKISWWKAFFYGRHGLNKKA